MPPGPARRGLLTFVVGGEPFEIPWPYLALHSPVWADKLAEDPNLAVIDLEGEPPCICRSRLSHRMSAPYLVTTHREHCTSCRREVDDDEVVVSGEGFRVHLGCGTVLEFEGLQPTGPQLAGADLASLSSEVDWLAEQRQILEQLSGGSKGRRRTGDGKKQRSIDAQSILRDAAAVATVCEGDSEERPLQWQLAGEAKRRRSPEEQFSTDPGRSQADNGKLPSAAMEADSFRAYLNFLQGADGPTGDLSPSNFLQILHWNQEFGVEHIRGQCEAFLLDPRCREAIELSPDEVLEIAARHDMPKLYEKAVEVTGQGMQYIQVPKGAPTKFDSEDLRTDVVKAHLSMGVMCADGEMRCRHRYADQALLPDAHERARLLWKSRGRFRKPAPAEPDHDWRCPQMVWPHHSFRGEDWTAIASETQPTLPRRSALRSEPRRRK
ncbi:unnamed protein product [Symbiodinium sp. CCMP2456]|nr:unnamed protein product [Symbiodinium sp. CCMP2456]